MKVSCEEAFFFSEDESRLIDAEYLLTVNVAKEIARLNNYIGVPYKIYLEKPTRKFASDCVPLMGRLPVSNFLGYRSTLRKSKNTTRNGKIDVVVYRDGVSFRKPVCAIELKGFNPRREVVLQDLKRNGEYFSLSCVSGSSQISFSVFAALHSFRKTHTTGSVKKDLQTLQAKYNGWLSKLGSSRNYKNNIRAFTISKSLADEQAIPPDEEFSEFESHHFVGVMVTFYGRNG